MSYNSADHELVQAAPTLRLPVARKNLFFFETISGLGGFLAEEASWSL